MSNDATNPSPISVTGGGNITTGTITNQNDGGAATNTVTITTSSSAAGAFIQTGAISTNGISNGSDGADISVNLIGTPSGGSITTGALNADGFAGAADAAGGAVTVFAGFGTNDITIGGGVSSRGNRNSDSGQITINSTGNLRVDGDIDASLQNPSGSTGTSNLIAISANSATPITINAASFGANNIGRILATGGSAQGAPNGSVGFTQSGTGGIAFGAVAGNAISADDSITINSAGDVTGSAVGNSIINGNAAGTVKLNATAAGVEIGNGTSQIQIDAAANQIKIGQNGNPIGAFDPASIGINRVNADGIQISDLTNAGPLQADNDIYISNGGGIFVDQTITSTSASGTVTLRSTTAGDITASGPLISSPSGAVVLTTANGNIGTSIGAEVFTNVAFITAKATGGGAFVNNGQGAEIVGNNGASSTGTYYVINSGSGNLTLNSAISAGSISLNTTGVGDTIEMGFAAGTLTGQDSGGSVSLTTNDGDIVSTTGSLIVNGKGTFVANLGTGDIDMTGATLSSTAVGISAEVGIDLNGANVTSSGRNVVLDASGGANTGAIKAVGNITTNSGVVVGDGGLVQLKSGTVTASADITTGAITSSGGSTSGSAGAVDIDGAGLVSIGAVQAKGTGAVASSGGNVKIGTLTGFSGLSVPSIDTSTSGTGNGGEINLTGSATGIVNVTAGDLQASSTGGAGGAVTIDALTVQVNGSIVSNSAVAGGGDVNIGQFGGTPTSMQINGDIVTSGGAAAAPGDITITVSTGGVYNINTGAAAAQTISGQILGNDVSFTNSGAGSGITLDGAGAAVAGKGLVTLSAADGGIDSTGAGSGQIDAPAISLSASGGGSIGGTNGIETLNSAATALNTSGTGSIDVTSLTSTDVSLVIGTVGNVFSFTNNAGGDITLPNTISPTNNGGVSVRVLNATGDILSVSNTSITTGNNNAQAGGDITLSTFDGAINLGTTGALNSSPTGANFAAGDISVTAGGTGAITTGAITANASGTGNNSGSAVVLSTNGASNITVGGNISSTSPRGDGGGIQVSAGTGGEIRVNGDIDARGKTGTGDVSLSENAGSTFHFNTGIGGANTVSGQVFGNIVDITNAGTGGIKFDNNLGTAVSGFDINVTAGTAGVAAGNIDGSGNGTPAQVQGALVATNDVNLVANANGATSGNIGTATTQVVFSAGNAVNFTADAGTGTAGDAYLVDLGTGNITLNVTGGSFGRDLSYSKVNGGNIEIGTGLTSSKNGTITIQISGGSGDILNTGGNVIQSTSGAVVLNANFGSVGVSGADVLTKTASIAANAGGATGEVWVSNNNAAGVTITGLNGAGAAGSYNLSNDLGTMILNTGISAGTINLNNSESGKNLFMGASAGTLNSLNPLGTINITLNDGNIGSIGGTLTATGSGSFSANLGTGNIVMVGTASSPAVSIAAQAGIDLNGANITTQGTAVSLDASGGAQTGTITNVGSITSNVGAATAGGAITLTAGTSSSGDITTGALNSSGGTAGAGGGVTIAGGGDITVPSINSSATGTVNAGGNVQIGSAGSAFKSLNMTGGINASGSGSGQGGSVSLRGSASASGITVGGDILADGGASGAGNNILINSAGVVGLAGLSAQANGALADGIAGSVTVGNLQAPTSFSSNAISTNTTLGSATGAGGNVAITAGSITVAGPINTSVASGQTGTAGTVTLTTTGAGNSVSTGGIDASGTSGSTVTISGGINTVVAGDIITTGSAGAGGGVSIDVAGAGSNADGTIAVAGLINTQGSTSGGSVSLLANKAGSTTSTIAVDDGITTDGSTAAGSVTVRVLNSASPLTLNADNSNPGANTVGPISAVGGGGGAVTVSNAHATGDVVLGGIVGNAVDAAGTISLTAGKSILGGGAGVGILQTTDTVSGITLLAGTDAGNTFNAITTNTSALSATATSGSILVLNSNTLPLNINTATAGGDITIESDNGLLLNANVDSTGGGDIQLFTASGDIARSGNFSIITTGNAKLTALAGNVGTSFAGNNSILTQAGSLTLSAGTDVFVQQTGTSTLTGTNQAGGSFNVKSTSGDLIVDSGIVAGSIALETQQANKHISMGSNAGLLQATGTTVNLTTNGGGINSVGGNLDVQAATTATLQLTNGANTGHVDMSATPGAFASIDANNGVDLKGGLLSANANLTTDGGNVFLASTNGAISNVGSITTNATAGDGGFVTISADGNITITGAINAKGVAAVASGGPINISTTNGTLEVDGAINNSSTGSGVAGTIILNQPSATLFINSATPGLNVIKGTITSGSSVEVHAGGITLAGAGTAITAASIGLDGGSNAILPDVAGNGGLNASSIVLTSSGADIGSTSSNLPITITTAGTTVVAANASGTGAEVSLETTGGALVVSTVSVGSINETGITADTNIRVSTTGNLQINTAAPIASVAGGNINLVADSLNTWGTGTLVDATSTGSVNIVRTANGAMQIGGAGAYISITQLGQILANSLSFGNNSGYTGDITLGAAVTNGAAAAGSAAGSYHLALLTGGKVNTGTFSITTNTNDLTINAQSAAATSASVAQIIGTGGDISITGKTGVTLNDSIATAGTGTITILSNGDTITGNSKAISAGTGTITIDNNGGSISSIGAVTSSGLIRIGTQDGLTSTATGVTVSGTVDNSGGTNQDVQILTNTNGINTAAILSSGDVRVLAINAIASGGISTGAITNTAGTGSVVVDSLTGSVSVGAVTSNGQISLGNIVSGTGVTLGGTVTNASGSGDVFIDAASGGVLGGQDVLSSGAILINATAGNVSLGAVNNTSGTDLVSVSATGGSTTVGAVSSNDSISITGKTGVTLNGAVSNLGGTGDVQITNTSGGVTGNANSVSAADGLTITNITSGGITFTGGTLRADNGNISVTALGASGNVQVNAVTNNTSAGSITVNAANGLSTVGFSSGAVLATDGDIAIGNSSGGTGVNVQGTVTTTGTGTIDILAASGTINGGGKSLQADTGTITVNPGTGNVSSLGSITSSGLINVGTSNGTTSTASTIQITGAINNSTGTANVNILNSTGGITTSTITSSGDVTVMGLAALFSGAISTGSIDNSSGSGDVNVIANSGSVTVGSVTSKGAITLGTNAVGGGSGLTLNGDVTNAGGTGNVSLLTDTGSISNAVSRNVTSVGDLTITNNNGSIGAGTALGNLQAGGGAFTLNVSSKGTLAVGSVTNNGGDVIISNNSLTTDITTGGISTSAANGGNVTIMGGKNATVNGSILTNGTAGDGGQITMDQSAALDGTISVIGNIVSSGTVNGGLVELYADNASSTNSAIRVNNGIAANGGTGAAGGVLIFVSGGSTLNVNANNLSPGANTIGPVSSTGATGNNVVISNGIGDVAFDKAGVAVDATGPISVSSGASILGNGSGFGTLRSASSVTLQAVVNAGSSSNIISLNTPGLTATATTGSINVVNTNVSTLQIFGADAGTSVSIVTNNGINLQGDVTSSGGGSITLDTSANGDISRSSSTTVISTSGNVTLKAKGNIGTAFGGGNDIETLAGSLTLQAGGSVFVNQTGGTASITGTNTAGAGGYNVLSSSGDLIITSAITGASIDLETQGAQDQIIMGVGAGQLKATSSFVNLTTNGGGISSTGGDLDILATTTSTLSLNTATEAGNIDMTGSHNKSVSIVAPDGIGLKGTGDLPANIDTDGGFVLLNAANGSIIDVGSINTSERGASGDGGAVTLTASDAVTINGGITAIGKVTQGGSVVVSSGTGQVQIDGSISNTSTGAATGGNVTITDNSGNALTVNGAVGPGSINGTISSNGDVVITANGIILDGAGTAISANRIGLDGMFDTISATAAGNGALSASSIALFADGGVGSAAGDVPITINSAGSPTVGAVATAGSSEAFISNIGGGFVFDSVTVGSVSAAGVSAGADIRIDTQAGSGITINDAGKIVSATAGNNITLNVGGISAPGTASPVIDASSTGTVNINPNNGAAQIAGSFISNATLGKIRAVDLTIGNLATYSGTLTLGANINNGTAAAGTTGSYNLSLLTTGKINTSGFSIITNANDLTINAQSAAATAVTVDQIVATGGDVSITANNGLGLSGSISNSGAGIVSLQADNGTIQLQFNTITAGTGTVTIDNTNGNIFQVGDITSAGTINIGNSTSGGSITALDGDIDNTANGTNSPVNILAFSGGIGGTGSVLSKGAITIKAEGGNVAIGGAVNNSGIGAVGAVEVNAVLGSTSVGPVLSNGTINIGTSDGSSSTGTGVSVLGFINNGSGTGDVNVLTLTGGITTGTIDSAGNVNIQALDGTSSGAVAVGNITNTAGTGTVVVDSLSGSISVADITSKNSITIGNLVGATGVTLTGTTIDNSSVTGNDIAILTNTGGISNVGTGNVFSGNALTLTVQSSGNIALSSGTLRAENGADLNVSNLGSGNTQVNAVTQLGSGDIVIEAVNGSTHTGFAGGTVSATAGGGSITIGNASSGTGVTLGGPVLTSGAGNISIVSDSGTITGNNKTISASAGTITVDPNTGDVVSLGAIISSGLINIGTSDGTTSNASGIDIVGGINNSSGTANVNILTSTGNINTSSIFSSGNVKVRVLSLGDITTGLINSSTGTGNITVIAADGSVTVGQINSTGNVQLGSQTTGTGVTLNGTVSSVGGGNGISIDTNTGGISGAGKNLTTDGNIFLTANNGDIAVGALLNTGINGSINLLASNGGITTGAITDNAVGSGNGGDVTLDASGAIFVSGSIDAMGIGGASKGGPIVVSSSGGSIRIDGSINNTTTGSGTTGFVSLFSNASLEINGASSGAGVINGSITSNGFVTIVSNGDITLSSAGTAIATTGGLTLSAGNDIKAGGANQGGLNAPQIELLAGNNIGSVTGNNEIRVTTPGTTTLAGSAGGETNINVTGGNLIVGTVGSSNGITSFNSIKLNANTGNLQIGTSAPVTSQSGTDTIALIADSINGWGTGTLVNAGGGAVQIAPGTATTQINLGSGASGIIFTAAIKDSIAAGTLTLGSGTATGGIAVNSAIDFSSNYNVTLLQGAGGVFTNAAGITMGNNDLTVNVGGAATVGAISGSNNTVDITAASILVNNQLLLSGTSTANLHATGVTGSGSISGFGLITAETTSLTSDNDFIAGSTGPTISLASATTDLTANAGGLISIGNTGALTSVNSTTSASFALFNNDDINVGASGINSSGAVNLGVTANNGSINVVNGSVSGVGLVSLQSNGTGGVLVDNQSLSSSADNILILSDNITNTAGVISGNAVSFTGQTVDGTGLSAMTVDNSGQVQAVTGGITINSAPGQDLNILGDGSGQFIMLQNNTTMDVIATDNPSGNHPNLVLGPGAQEFIVGDGLGPVGSFVNFTAQGVVTSSITINSTYTFTNDYSHVTVTTGTFFGNPADFDILNPPNIHSTLSFVSPYAGTIANSNGDIDVGGITNLSFGGPITFLASGNIFSNVARTISVTAAGVGGTLNLIAGFDFTPPASPSLPSAQTYTLSGPSSGGNIDLSLVDIDTTGASSGGNVFAIANGSVALGKIDTSSSGGPAGSVTITGSGATLAVGDITATGSTFDGNVTIKSAASVGLAGATQITNGAITGAGFSATGRSGAITVNNIVTPGASVSIDGGTITGASLTSITSTFLDLTANSGTIQGASGPLSTVVSNGLNVNNVTGSANISNTGALANLNAFTGGSFTLSNVGNVTLTGQVTGATGVSISLDNGSSLDLNGLTIASTNSAISLTTDTIAFGGGAIDAGTGTVTIAPSDSNTTLSLGGSGTLNLTQANLNKISAGTLVFGSNTSDGGITVGSNIDVSAHYSLSFLQLGGDFDSSGFDVAVGAQNLSISVGGDVNLGTLTTSTSTVSISGNNVTLNGNIGSPTDTTSITASGGDIVDGATSTITAANLTLTANGDAAGLTTAVVGSLTVDAGNTIDISNTGAINFNTPTFANGSITLNNAGNVTLTSTVHGDAGVNLILSGTAGVTLNRGAFNISATNNDITLVADSMPGSGLIQAGTGNVFIDTATSSTTINLATGSGGLDFTATQMNSIFASNLTFGSLTHTGDITVGTFSVGGIYNLNLLAGGPGGDVVIPSGQALTMDNRSLQVVAGNAVAIQGSISSTDSLIDLTGGSVVINGSVINTDAGNAITNVTATTADITGAGSISVQTGILNLTAETGINILTAVNNGVLNAVTTAGDITLSNTGTLPDFTAAANSGAVTLVNSVGGVTLNTAGGVFGSNGVTITLAAGNILDLNGATVSSTDSQIALTMDTLNFNGGAIDAAAGPVFLAPVKSDRPITIGNVVANTLNFSEAEINAITAGQVIIGSGNTTGGITVDPDLSINSSFNLSFVQGASGNFTSKNIDMTGGGNLVVSLGGGNITVNNLSNSAIGGSIILQTDGTGVIDLNTGFTPDAHIIGLLAGTGTIDFSAYAPGTITFQPQFDGAGNGGTVDMSASNLRSTLATHPMVLNVSSGTANGGTANWVNTDAVAFSPLSTQLVLNISGALDQGSATISTGGDLTFSPSGGVVVTSNTFTGNGASYTLVAGNQIASSATQGKLLVTGALNANASGVGNDGGNIILSSNSTTVFNIGATATSNINGIRGAISANAGGTGGDNGTLSVINKSAGITSSTQALTAFDSISFNTVGATNGKLTITKALGDAGTSSISLAAGGSGTIALGSIVVTGDSIDLSSGTGAISGTKLNTASISASTGGTTSTVNLTNTRAGLLTINGSGSGGAFSIKNTTAGSGMDIVAGIVSGTTSTAGKITLSATGNITGSSGFMQAKTISLTSTGASNFGTGTAQAGALNMSTTSLSLNGATGLANINNQIFGTTGLTITAAKTASTFTVRSDSSVKVSPALANVTGVLIDTSNGSGGITVAAMGKSTTAGLMTLTTSSGNITGGTLTTSGGVILSTTTGAIGTATAAFKVATPLLTVTPSATAGLINISNTRTGAVSVTTPLQSTGAVTFTSSGQPTFNGNISGTAVTLKTAGTTTVNGNITASAGAVKLTESGTGNTNITGNVSSATSTVSLQAVGGLTVGNITGGGGNVTVTAKGTSTLGVVTAGGTGTVAITQTGGGLLTVGGGTAAGNTYTVSTTGAGLTTTGPIQAIKTVTLKTTGANSSLTVNGNLTVTDGAAGVINLQAAGTGSITGTGTMSGRTVNLTSGSGSLGTGNVIGTALNIAANFVAAKSTGLANINNTGGSALTLSAATVNGNAFTLRSGAGVSTTQTLANASSITIDTSAGAGGIALGSALGGTSKTGTIALTTNSGNITGNTTLTTNSTGSVTLASTSGNFGTNSTTTPLKTNSPTVNLGTTTGFINVRDTSAGATTFGAMAGSSVTLKTTGATTFGNINAGTGAVTLTGAGTGNQSFNNVIAGTSVTMTTVGNTTFNGNVTANDGSISVTENTGLMTINGGFSATGASASITLLEKANTASSGIIFNNGASMSTNVTVKPVGSTTFPLPGQISVVIGSTVPTSPVTGTPPTNVTQNGAHGIYHVYWGTNGVQANGATANNVLNIVNDTAIVFSAGTKAPITLNGTAPNGVVITADPPASSSAAPMLLINQDQAQLNSMKAAPAIQSNGGYATVPSYSVPAFSPAEQMQTYAPAPAAAALPVQTAPTNVFNSANPKVLEGGVSESATADYGFGINGSYGRSAGGSPASNSNSDIEAVISSEKDLGISTAALTEKPSSSSAKKVVALNKGNIIFAPSVDTRVETPFGNIDVDAKSVALIFASDRGVAVFNLDDMHRDAVRFHAGGQKLVLAPGRHVVVTSKAVKSFEMVNAVEAIGYRFITDTELGEGLRAFSAEFSIPSAIGAIKPLKSMINSKTPEAIRLRTHLIKTVAAMFQMKPGSERFQQVMRPRMAAYNNNN